MDDAEAMAFIADLIGSHLDIDPSAIKSDTTLVDDLALDSLDASALLIAIGRRTGSVLTIDGFDSTTTVGDVVRMMTSEESSEPDQSGPAPVQYTSS